MSENKKPKTIFDVIEEAVDAIQERLEERATVQTPEGDNQERTSIEDMLEESPKEKKGKSIFDMILGGDDDKEEAATSVEEVAEKAPPKKKKPKTIFDVLFGDDEEDEDQEVIVSEEEAQMPADTVEECVEEHYAEEDCEAEGPIIEADSPFTPDKADEKPIVRRKPIPVDASKKPKALDSKTKKKEKYPHLEREVADAELENMDYGEYIEDIVERMRDKLEDKLEAFRDKNRDMEAKMEKRHEGILAKLERRLDKWQGQAPEERKNKIEKKRKQFAEKRRELEEKRRELKEKRRELGGRNRELGEKQRELAERFKGGGRGRGKQKSRGGKTKGRKRKDD